MKVAEGGGGGSGIYGQWMSSERIDKLRLTRTKERKDRHINCEQKVLKQ